LNDASFELLQKIIMLQSAPHVNRKGAHSNGAGNGPSLYREEAVLPISHIPKILTAAVEKSDCEPWVEYLRSILRRNYRLDVVGGVMFKVGILFAMPIGIASMLGGCGTYVPEIQEFPGGAAAGQLFVQAIVQNITCEVQNSIYNVISGDKEDLRNGVIPWRQTSWLDSWGVQVTLSLQVDETGGLNPTVSWMPPSPMAAIFNLDAGATLSADALRIDKLNSYYSVKELYSRSRCNPADRPGGLFLLQNDLKLEEWLSDVVMLQGTGAATLPNSTDGPFKQDVISHEVKFVVVSSATVTPGWKLTRVSINQTGSLLSAGRTRTHDLTITLGPMDKVAAAKGIKAPSTAASNSHLASEIGLAVANSIRTVPLSR
jgi:hypothetical protein